MRLPSDARSASRPAAALALLVGLAAAFGTAAVHAQTAAALQTRSLAATCASCHGTNGRSVDGAAVPGLAGLPAAYMVEQMKAFKSGARTATVMHQIAKGYSDAQIDQLAAYYAAQKK
jgi:cytochrome subunit of sulfide dehydrogenase